MKIYTRLTYWATCVLLFVAAHTKAQYISAYTFSQSYNTYSPVTSGITYASGTIFTGDSYTASLPFGFNFDGTIYTSLYINTNGYITFDYGGGDCCPISSSGFYKAISAFGFDLAGTSTFCALRSAVEGAAPNRTFVVEWENMDLWSYSGANLNFQIRLHETTNIIDFVYGSMSTTVVAPLVQVGIRGSSNTQYKNRSGSSDWSSTVAGSSSAATVKLSNVYVPTVGLTYTWTPPPPCTAPALQPTALSFTSTNTTVHGTFTAAAGATGYLVVRTSGTSLSATPENGVTYTTGSLLGGGVVVGSYTGTSFTDAGLSPLTNYTYTIFAYKSMTCPGIGYNTVLPLTDAFSTTGPRKYTWLPTSGTNDYNTALNWSPARTHIDINDTLVFNNGGSVNIINVPQQMLNGLTIAGGTNVTMTSAVNDSLGLYKYLDIQAGSLLTLTGANTLKIYFAAGYGATASISGTLNLGGSSGYNATNAVTTITGTVTDSGANATMTTYCSCYTSILFNAGSTYNHARNGGGVPRATYASTSTVNITGVINTAPSFSGSAELGDLVWNSPGQNQTVTMSNVIAMQRDFKIISTGTDTVAYGNNGPLSVGRDFIQTGGAYRISTNTNGKMKVLRNITLSGGALDLNRYTSSIVQTNLLVYGNLTQNPGHTITKTGTAGSLISFCGDTHQNIVANGAMTNTKIGYILNNATGATLTGNLPVSTGGTNTIMRGMWDGTGHFGYDVTGDSLIYSSAEPLTATGVEWPAFNPPANVVLRMTGSGTANQIALPGNRIASTSVRCENGILVLNNYDLQITSTTGSVFTTSDTTGMIAADSTGRLIMAMAASTTSSGKNWPVGTLKNGKSFAQLTITLASNSVLRNIGIRCPHRKHPNEPSTTNYMNIYWAVTDDGGSAPYVLNNLAMRFATEDLIGAPEMRVCNWDGATWTQLPGLSTEISMATNSNTYLDGRDFTGQPTQHPVYTWTGAISKDYAVPGNWTPNRIARTSADFLLFNSGNTDSVKNVIANDTVAQVKVTNNTFTIWQAGTSTSSSYYIIRNLDPASGGFIVDSGSSFLMASPTNSLRISFSSVDTTYNTIAGTVELQSNSTAVNNINFANSITTVTSSGKLAAGSMSIYASFTGDPSCLFINGTYEHKFTTVAGAIPGATWGDGSVCLIDGYTTGGSPAGGLYPIRKLVYNCPALITVSNFTNLPPITDSFIVVSTGSSSLRLSASVSVMYRFNHFKQTGGLVDIYQSPVNVSGSFTQSGGSFFSSSSIGPATLNFNGTSTQSVSFNNAAPTGTIIYRVSNPAGINLLGTGTLTSDFAINNGGGVRISTPGTNPISSSLTLVYDTAGTTLTYDTVAGYSTASYVADAAVFPLVNGPSNLTVNVGNNSTLQLPFSRTVPRTLTMQAGDILIGGNTLSIGKSATSTGTLNWVGGYVVPTTGALCRWFGTSGLPTSAGTSVGYYPLKYGSALRSAAIYFSSSIALSSAGYITVASDNTPGFTTGLSVIDGTETMTLRNNSPWTFAAGGGLSLSGSIGAQITGGNMFSYVNPTRLHMMKSGSVVGVHTTGSGTAPNFSAARTGMTLTELTSSPFYIGAQDTTFSSPGAYISVANGSWNSATTWNFGAVPPSDATVFIANGKTVTINSTTCVAAKLTINPGATLTGTTGGILKVDTFITNNGTFRVSGDSVVLGPVNGGNRPFTGRGTLTIDSGTLKINGYLRMNGGSVFNQTGGNVSIDGNAAGVISNSITTAESIIRFDTCTINASGGTITLTDPQISLYGNALYAHSGAGLGTGFTGNHTFVFGDGVSTTSGSAMGFLTDCTIPINNVTIKGSPSGTGRLLQLYNNITINGDIQLVGSTAKFDDNAKTIHLYGNMFADAGATSYFLGTLDFANPSQPQSVNGPGSYYNNYGTSYTANFTSLTLHNGSVAGVTLNLVDPSFSGTLLFYNGQLRAGTGAIVNAGTSSPTTAGPATGWVIGKYRRSISTSTTSAYYPIGDSQYYAGMTLSFSAGVITAGAITASTIGTDHPAIGSSLISPWQSINRYYTIDTSGGLRLPAYGSSLAADWNGADQDIAINWATFGAASFRGSTWRTETIALNTATNASIVNLGNDIAASYQFGARASTSFLTSQPANQTVCINTNASFSVGAAIGSTYLWQVNDGSGWANTVSGSLYSGVATATLTIAAVPVSMSGNMYRCKVRNGSDSLFTMPVTLTVGSLAGAITGSSMAVCTGLSIALSNSTPGGSWSSGGAATCTIGSATGVATGISAGTALISYTLPTGCRSTAIVTVNINPTSVTGILSMCAGASTTLNSTPAGGTWSTSNPGIATVGSSSGIVAGIAAGTSTISYTVGAAACLSTAIVTVNALPATIVGTLSVCTGASTTLTDATTGGLWGSGSGNCTVGSTSGIVTGISAGTSVILYTTSTGCTRTATVTINASPAALIGVVPICEGATTTFASATSGGTWTSTAPGTATVNASGLISGISSGTANITYRLPITGCYATSVATVNAPPDNITGSSIICAGSNTVLSGTPAGGTWSSSAGSIVSIGSVSAIANGLAAGTSIITYRLPTGCYATKGMTVNPLPASITGILTACSGSFSLLSSTSPDGEWTSSAVGIASVDITSGTVSGISPGTATITYTIPTGCYSTAVYTVNASPSSILGAMAVCIGNTSLLSSPLAIGSWSSGTAGVATVGSTSGILTGITAGTSVITFSFSNGCYISSIATVNPLPAAITGLSVLCQGTTATLTDATPGGTWASSTSAVATIGVTSGGITATSAGTTTITYTLPTGCNSTKDLTVNPLPAAITGPASVCKGSTITLSSTSGGGTWSSSVLSVANVNEATGIVTGMGAGSTIITYTLPTGCFVTRTVSADTIPVFTVNGTDYICIGTPATFTSPITGGTWSTSNSAIASVSGSGVVTGLTSGSVSVSYSITNVCGTFNVAKSIAVYTQAQCDSALGASEMRTEPISIELFPNPNNGTFSVTIHSASQELLNISIRNQMGQKVWEGNAVSNKLFRVTADIAPGVYMLFAEGKSGSYFAKFVNTSGR